MFDEKLGRLRILRGGDALERMEVEPADVEAIHMKLDAQPLRLLEPLLHILRDEFVERFHRRRKEVGIRGFREEVEPREAGEDVERDARRGRPTREPRPEPLVGPRKAKLLKAPRLLAREAVLSEEIPGITVTAEKGRIIFRPDGVNAGLIFYPGGKVEYTAYTPLMKALAERGFLCVLLEMPLNLAFLNVNAADAVFSDFPEVENWYLAGHSLGGVAAALYTEKHVDRLDGLILLGAYSTANLKEKCLKLLSIYGSEDSILHIKELEKNRSNLPEDLTGVIIPGGCHAYFGAYGEQKGDGIPAISREEQILITAGEIENFIKK